MRVTLILSIAVTLSLASCTDQPDQSRLGEIRSNLSLYYDPTVSLSSGLNNDLSLPSSSAVVSVAAHSSGSTVTGVDSSFANQGDVFWLLNESANVLTATDSDTNSSSANRLHLPDGQSIVIPPGRSIAIQYSPVDVVGWRTLTPPGVRNVSSTSTPSRTLGTAFRPSVSRLIVVYYSARVSTPLTISGGAVGRVELLSDSSNPPTTVRARVACGSTGAVLVGTSTATLCESELHYLVPIGDYVLLQSVTESGSPTYSINAQSEQTL